jgi:dienelactone hydrolase
MQCAGDYEAWRYRSELPRVALGLREVSFLQVYISKPASTESQTSLLVLLSNGVGIHSINNQIQADHFARVGYFVVMPDMLDAPLRTMDLYLCGKC